MKIFPRLKRFGKTAGHDRPAYRDYQIEIGSYYLINYVKPFVKEKKILDIGCAEGGVLEAFEKDGFDCTGLEYSEHRIEYAKQASSEKIKFIQGDIEGEKLESLEDENTTSSETDNSQKDEGKEDEKPTTPKSNDEKSESVKDDVKESGNGDEKKEDVKEEKKDGSN